MTDEIVKSPEKVRALLDELPAMLAGGSDPQLQSLVGGAWPMFKPVVLQRLPEEAEQLDVLLESIAIMALRARSDDAKGFMLRVDGAELQVATLDHLRAAAAADTNGGTAHDEAGDGGEEG